MVCLSISLTAPLSLLRAPGPIPQRSGHENIQSRSVPRLRKWVGDSRDQGLRNQETPRQPSSLIPQRRLQDRQHTPLRAPGGFSSKSRVTDLQDVPWQTVQRTVFLSPEYRRL
ncbi:hypothetical protein B0H10DRAFT_2083765 [Mycena sp. CBHHK59/15]|nr:hypothetical protein B0H10DRAFT_2125824 [Mycena sp. CBHHK59/15]KAJ6591982.1 hypothetical protein B0H10DRAFT_2090540 [Mycena sp. CBHHK59/15]KAJ6600088.1 hypothetical protein B0H10DRAFT_2083765 [Mycena sp. CBHHK59/15]